MFIHLIMLIKVKIVKNLDLESIIILIICFLLIYLILSLFVLPTLNAFAFYWILLFLIYIKQKKY